MNEIIILMAKDLALQALQALILICDIFGRQDLVVDYLEAKSLLLGSKNPELPKTLQEESI